MPQRKTDIYKRLTRSHLEAIGRVAATWSLLERMVLSTLSTISGVGLDKAITLAGPSAFASWIDMLLSLARSSKEHKHKEGEYEAISKLLLKLLNRRNYIVHAVWQIPLHGGPGLINRRMYAAPTASSKIEADGFPKRGREWIIRVAWTSKQMRHIATLIEKARIMLLEIQMRPLPASPKERISHTHLRQRNLHKIRAMLDSLPDPFRK